MNKIVYLLLLITVFTKAQGIFPINNGNSLQGELTDQNVHLQGIKPIKLSAGVTYEMSGRFKANGKTTGTNEYMSFSIFETNNPASYREWIYVWSSNPNLQEPANIEWTYSSKIFTPTKDVIVFFDIFSGIDNFWFDDLEITAK